MKGTIQALKLAQKSLRNRPGFVATTVVTLALTLGALIAVFNLNYLLLVKPLPYPHQSELGVVDHFIVDGQQRPSSYGRSIPASIVSYKNHLSSPNPIFADMAIFHQRRAFLRSHAQQPRVSVMFTTAQYFEMLATPTHLKLGRYFSKKEDLGQHKPVAVISYDAWQRLFSGMEDVIGQQIQVDQTHFKVIGVMAQTFVQPQLFNRNNDIWLPWDFHGFDNEQLNSWFNTKSDVAMLVRHAADKSVDIAQRQSSALLNSEYQKVIDFTALANKRTHYQSIISPLRTRLTGDSADTALLLLMAVAGLLLIACTNVINLFYSRAAQKQRTFAIQAALGARKSHLFQTMFAETLILMVISGLLGLLVGAWYFELLKQLGQGQLPRLSELELDAITLLFTLILTVSLALIFAFLSSKVVNYDALHEQLKSSGKGGGLQVPKMVRNILIVSQMTMATLLLTGALIVLQNSYSVLTQPSGFNSAHLYSLELEGSTKPDVRQIQKIRQALSSVASVNNVTASYDTPVQSTMSMSLQNLKNDKLGAYPANFVDERYFSALGMKMLLGETFHKQQITDNSPVVIVSQSAAKLLHPKGRALGMTVTNGGVLSSKVIGIVQDIIDPSRGVNDAAQKVNVYFPYAPWNFHYLLRLKEPSALTKLALETLLQAIDPSLHIVRYNSIDNTRHQLLRIDRLNAGIAIGLSLLSLLIAGVGMFGVLSYSSHMRRYELGVRMALGARTGKIVMLVLKDNLLPLLIGIGLSFSLVVLFSVLYPQPNMSFPILPLLATLPFLLATGLLASYLPVRKVIHQDPLKALRNE
jgi:predicted permease